MLYKSICTFRLYFVAYILKCQNLFLFFQMWRVKGNTAYCQANKIAFFVSEKTVQHIINFHLHLPTSRHKHKGLMACGAERWNCMTRSRQISVSPINSEPWHCASLKIHFKSSLWVWLYINSIRKQPGDQLCRRVAHDEQFKKGCWYFSCSATRWKVTTSLTSKCQS